MSGNTQQKKEAPKKKGLTNTLKYFFGVGDAGFVLMSNIETFYFMTFLTDLAGFGSAIAGIINGTKAKKWADTDPGFFKSNLE